MALYFEWRINKNASPSDCFFGDFAHWAIPVPVFKGKTTYKKKDYNKQTQTNLTR